MLRHTRIRETYGKPLPLSYVEMKKQIACKENQSSQGSNPQPLDYVFPEVLVSALSITGTGVIGSGASEKVYWL